MFDHPRTLNCALLEGHEVDLQIARQLQFQMLWAFNSLIFPDRKPTP
jgi:hypothetical protein